MEGIHTKKLVEEPGEAAIVREIFDMYEQPDTSYGDITRYYAEKGVQFYGKELIRSMLAQLLRNPVYVRLIWMCTVFQEPWNQYSKQSGAV